MKIHKLELENFHGFERLELALDPSLTLLIGENGAGKTAVLEGLAVVLGVMSIPLGVVPPDALRAEDVRVRTYEHEGLLDRQMQWPVRVGAAGTIEGQEVRWTRSRDSIEVYPNWTSSSAALVADLAGKVRSGEQPVEGLGPSPREHLRYAAGGEALPSDTPQRELVQRDIDALNLNATRLRGERTIVYEELKRRLDRAGWSPKALREEHRKCRIEPGVRANPQCAVVRYHLERWARQRALEL